MRIFMLSDVDPRWSLLYQERTLMIFDAFENPYWPLCGSEAAVSPPIHDGSSRQTHMGINYSVLARFLCPIGEIARCDEDSKTQGLFFGLTICAIDYTSERSSG
jgi:hypothetical protein